MDNKFFTFIKPYLSFIDKGDFFRKPFSWLYIAFAVLNLILPFYILYTAIDNNIFDTPAAKFIIVFILVWIVIAFASWVCFQLWWDRKNKVTETSVENSEFVATPVFAHFIQTFGEWIGTWIGIVGFFVALLATIILGSDAVYLNAAIGVPFIQSGIASIILMPIYGFLIVVGSRFLAEMCRALASIANNTKKN